MEMEINGQNLDLFNRIGLIRMQSHGTLGPAFKQPMWSHRFTLCDYALRLHRETKMQFGPFGSNFGGFLYCLGTIS